MAAFLHPGIYVLEAGQPAGTILPAPTSTTIFVGETERGPLTPTLLTSRSDYTRIFGGYLRTNSVTNATSPTLGYAMDAFFNNGGTTCYVLRAMNGSPGAVASRTLPSSPTVKVNASSPGTWANGTTTNGVSVLFFPATDGSASRFRIVIVYTPLDTGVQSIVEDWDRLSIDPNDDNYVVDILNNRSLYIVWDPNTQPAIPTTFDWTGSQPPSPAQILALAATPLTPGSPIGKYGLGSNDNPGSVAGMGGDTDAALADFNFSLLDDIDDAALLVIPRVNDDSTVPSLNDAAIAYVTTRPHLDLFYIGSLSRHNNRTAATDAVKDALDEFQAASLPKSDFAALYFPWVFVGDPVGSSPNALVAVSPSAIMAGVYARTDEERGVWKAPAGTDATLTGVRRLEFDIQDIQQDIMNPVGINALRNIPNVGPVSWAARTAAAVVSSQWRYIPVRRMAMFLRKSIYDSIQFAVFENNDEPLWASLRLSIETFMQTLYRQGAFAGSSSDEAYFVKCDSETTTPADQLAGVCNVLVGFAPVRPAEFVVVKLSQVVA